MATKERLRIAELARASTSGVISLPVAAKAMGVSRRAAALRLHRLARLGWLEHLRRGLYLVKPLDAASDHTAIPEDPWTLASEVFSPCYIGGWSAAEHWQLTEQIFRSTLVVTAVHARSTEIRIGGHDFHVFRVRGDRLSAGIAKVWRGAHRVNLSGLERTVADALRNPELVGGGRHLVQILRAYGEDERHSFSRLLDVCTKTGSGAAWKRLGFLSERLWPTETTITAAARRHMSAGYARLDPSNPNRGKLTKRWRLWINVPQPDLRSDSEAS